MKSWLITILLQAIWLVNLYLFYRLGQQKAFGTILKHLLRHWELKPHQKRSADYHLGWLQSHEDAWRLIREAEPPGFFPKVSIRTRPDIPPTLEVPDAMR